MALFDAGFNLSPAGNVTGNLANLQNTALAQQAASLQNQSAQQALMQKRRMLAVSMLNGIANEQDPAKQAELYATLKPMAERYDPSLKLPDQYDPEMSKALMFSQIPAAAMPEYLMNSAKARFYSQLAGGQAAPQQPQSSGAPTASPQAAPNSAPSLLDNPNTAAAMAIFDPAGATALSSVQKMKYESPEGKGATEGATNAAKQVAQNNQDIMLANLLLDNYQQALQPDPNFGGKSAAEAAPGGKFASDKAAYDITAPSFLPGVNPEEGHAYGKLSTLLVPQAAANAKENLQRVTGMEFGKFAESQGLDQDPAYRSTIIRQNMDMVRKKRDALLAQNKQLDPTGQYGANSPPSIQPPLNTQAQMQTLMAAKAAIAKGAPAAAVKKRLIDNGLNPSLIGL